MGALSDPGDATALVEGIRTLVDSPGLRTETAESGHERAADFSLGTITDAYLRLYNR
jgi:glycosyltransferase involved in cell wall biosynthesis